MYVAYLSDALQSWDCDLTRDELVDHAVSSCAHLLTMRLSPNRSAHDLLAAEVAYDRTLVRLCDEIGVATSATSFADPMAERHRIEQLLVESHDLDVNGLARIRRRT
jgi:hypothetical protein